MNTLTIKELETVGKLEPNSLILGDCLRAMKFVAEESVDLILCDLPYG